MARKIAFACLLACLCSQNAHAALSELSLSPHRNNEVIRLDVRVEGEDKRQLEPEEELARILEQVRKGELPRILFDFDSANIRKESQPTLDAIFDLLRRNPKRKLLIIAHTCDIGTEKYNMELSRRRAKAVGTYLTKLGIPPPSIRFRGKGYSEPIASNDTEAGRSKNRRVEFVLLRRWWSSVY